MAKVVMMPRMGKAVSTVPSKHEGCGFQLQGKTIELDCSSCPNADDAPTEMCLKAFRSALDAHREATGIILHGSRDIWVRESGVNSLRTLMAAEQAWEGLRLTLSSLPCPRAIPMERINRYLERVRTNPSDLFCMGEGAGCTVCLERQRDALESMRSDGRRAKKTLAADRFRITEVPGGSER